MFLPMVMAGLLSCAGLAAGISSARAADAGAASPPEGDLGSEQGALESEVQRLTKERKELELTERDLQKALREQSQRLQEQQRLLDEQANKIQSQTQSLKEQKRRLDNLKLKIEDLVLPPVPPGEAPAPPSPPPAPAAPPPPAAAPKSAPTPEPTPALPKLAPAPTPPSAPAAPAPGELPSTPVGRAPQPPERPTAQIADILEQRGILTPKGTLVVEPSFQYTNSSVTRVALEGFTIIPSITIGSIDIRSVNRNTYTTALALRYGLAQRFEIETQVPFVHRSDITTSRPLAQPSQEDQITEVSGTGLGDVEVAARYQWARPNHDWPYFVTNLRVKSRTGDDPFDIPIDPNTGFQERLPTGSGFWGVQPSLSFSRPSDPAVFFGSLSYLWIIERKINDELGRIDPGNAFGLSFGMGMAINQDASFTLGYSHNSVSQTRQNGSPLKGSQRLQVGSLLVGLSHRAGRNTSIALSLGVGVTQDAPNVQVSLRLPTNFKLRK